MMELEEQSRGEAAERSKEDMIRHIGSSSESAAQALRAMNPPMNSAQHFNIFDTHSDSDHSFTTGTTRIRHIE